MFNWLPIHYMCIYKLMTIMYKRLQENEPQYLAHKLHIATVDQMTRYNKSNIKLLQYHSTRKGHKETEDLALEDPITGTNCLTTSRKQRA